MSRWQRTEPAHLGGWGSLCPLRIPQEPLDLRENTALPERGLRRADNPNQSLTLLSFQATQLLNSDPTAWARRSDVTGGPNYGHSQLNSNLIQSLSQGFTLGWG